MTSTLGDNICGIKSRGGAGRCAGADYSTTMKKSPDVSLVYDDCSDAADTTSCVDARDVAENSGDHIGHSRLQGPSLGIGGRFRRVHYDGVGPWLPLPTLP